MANFTCPDIHSEAAIDILNESVLSWPGYPDLTENELKRSPNKLPTGHPEVNIHHNPGKEHKKISQNFKKGTMTNQQEQNDPPKIKVPRTEPEPINAKAALISGGKSIRVYADAAKTKFWGWIAKLDMLHDSPLLIITNDVNYALKFNMYYSSESGEIVPYTEDGYLGWEGDGDVNAPYVDFACLTSWASSSYWTWPLGPGTDAGRIQLSGYPNWRLSILEQELPYPNESRIYINPDGHGVTLYCEWW